MTTPSAKHHCWFNGQPAHVDQLIQVIGNRYGHFTTIRIEQDAVQGWPLHFQRLAANTQQLFGTTLSEPVLRAQIRTALAAVASDQVSLRVSIVSSAFNLQAPSATVPVDVLLWLRPWSANARPALRLATVRHTRALTAVKHLGFCPDVYWRRHVQMQGYDDALFIDEHGDLSEGVFWNVGFWDGRQMIWPKAAMLAGTCQALLERGLAALGVTQITRSMTETDLTTVTAAFVCNTHGCLAVQAINHQVLPQLPPLTLLAQALEQTPWLPI